MTHHTNEQARQHMQDEGNKMSLQSKLVQGDPTTFLGTSGFRKVGKGVFTLIKNLLTRKATKSTSTVKEIANESLRRGLNKGDKINPTY